MRSLPQVLHEAAQRSAWEIILEANEHPVIRTAEGSESLGQPFDERELFDALGQVLGPDQQAELAVGHAVEFHIESGTTRWSLITEARAQGIIVRGRSSTEAAKKAEIGIAIDLPPLEHFETEADPAPEVRSSVLNRATRRTALDLAASRFEDPPEEQAEAVQVASTTGRPSWLESNDGFAEDFELRQTKPTVQGIELREREPASEASFGAQVRALEPGTLCLLRCQPGSPDLARTLEDARVLDETTPDARWVSAVVGEGGTYWVRLEDPSVRLGWMLRRLEEGARVIVETRAQSFEGARRVLLGVDASLRAEAWLSAHRVCWLVAHGGTVEG